MSTDELTAPSTGGWFSAQKRPVTTMVSTSFLSAVSNQMTGIAVPWFVLTLTGSASQTGLTAAVTLLPSVVMAFFGGAVADRMNARKLAIYSDVISGVTVALVPLLYLLDRLTFPLLLLLMFLGAVFDTPGATARRTMVPRLSERCGVSLEKINSAYGVSFALSSILGAALSGVLIGVLGATNVMWFNAATFGISALAMRFLVPDLGINPPSGNSLLKDVREGFRYVWNDGFVRTLTFSALVINFVYSPVFGVVMPYYAKIEYDSATALGFIAASYGIGALIGSLAYGVIGERFSRRTMMLVSAGLLSVPMAGMIPVPGFWWTIAIMSLCSIGSGLVNPMIGTLMMKRTPQHLLGRVQGVVQAGAMMASPLGLIIVGPLLDGIGMRGTFSMVSAILLGVFLVVVFSRSMRAIDDPGVVEPAAV